MSAALLEIRQLRASYGEAEVLHGIDLIGVARRVRLHHRGEHRGEKHDPALDLAAGAEVERDHAFRRRRSHGAWPRMKSPRSASPMFPKDARFFRT